MEPRDTEELEGHIEAERLPHQGAAGASRWLVPLTLCAAVCFGSAVRIHTALRDPNFDTHSPAGLLRSDPGLLFYITERIIEAGGLPPEDFRADRRIEYPEGCDVPAMFTVGQEFLVAWCYLLLKPDMPLHVFCVWVMGIFASLAVVGVYGLARELTGRQSWALLATGLFLILPANYRTIGFILIREDFSIPWLSLHLFLFARAVRVRNLFSYTLVAVTLVAAVASWHAMGVVLTIEALCLLAWFLRTGRNPLAVRGAWLVLVIIMGASLVIPVLRSKLFGLSPVVLMALSLLVAALVGRWRKRYGVDRLVAVVCLGALLIVSAVVGRWRQGGVSDYAHVVALLKAKILHLGVLPADPSTIPFDARLLWQGPFRTATAEDLFGGLGIGLLLLAVALVLAVPLWRAGRGDGRVALLLAFAVAGGITAWLIRRTIILPGLTLPVVAAVALAQMRRPAQRRGLLAGGVLIQVALFAAWLGGHRITWYRPAYRNAETARLVTWIDEHIPADQAMAADFLNSTAVLAHARRPILLQPKYETYRSRRRIEEFVTTFLSGSLQELKELLRRYQCRYIIVDGEYLCRGSRYLAGMGGSEGPPTAGTAAALLCGPEDQVSLDASGFALLYQSRAEMGQGLFRVFEWIGTPGDATLADDRPGPDPPS